MFSIAFLVSSFFLFLFGTVIGSFLNVLIYRSFNDQDWKTGRSRCDHCHTTLAWYDMIPLVSYLVLWGRCRQCHKRIALSHFVLELLTGALFLWWYWFGFFFFQLTQAPYSLLQPVFWLFVGVMLLVVFVADLKYLIIPDEAVIALLFSAFGYRLALALSGVMQWSDFFFAVLAGGVATLFFFCLWFFTNGKGMGFGDVKLVGPLCLLMGWQRSIAGIFLSFIIGAVVGLTLLVLGKKKLKQPIPFGPFLVIGTVLSLFWGEQLVRWYLGLLFLQ